MKSKIVLMALAAMMMVGLAQAGLNLIPNPSFELGSGTVPDDWSLTEGADRITWETNTNNGSKSMLLTGFGNKPEATISSTDPIAVTAGTEYAFSAWVKSMTGAAASGTNLRLRWNDAAGNGIGGGWNNFSWYGVDAGAGWDEVTAVTIEAPAGAVNLDLAWLYSWKGTPNDGVYIGSVSMVEVPEPMTLCLLGLGGLILRRKKA